MFTLNCKGKLLIIDKPIVMGIINATPDSFYENSRKLNVDKALQKAEQMLNEGAAILDIGGQSTKPGSQTINATEELERVLPIIQSIHKTFPEAFISVDTYYSKVAEEAVNAGACIVNDISGGLQDEAMLSTVAALKVPYICMHMKGTPQNMQLNPMYKNVTKEVLDFFIIQTVKCKAAGIHDVIIDIGFGFGKTATHNFQLLKELQIFKTLEKPVLIGVSRKNTIYKTLNVTANEALNGTTVLNTVALLNGANILRVHDVKEAVEAVKLVEAMQ
ncbi:MAG: dihydropteroate synthase [Bacteroidetes bacterium]|nr:dihydropteroate synthase [Bacteroidota bacterium]MBS1671036.1 dihydropteroate synthase [Bacteroidota bacterium]